MSCAHGIVCVQLDFVPICGGANLSLINKVSSNVSRSFVKFISEESGAGIADYGAILALVMLGAGLAAGCLLFS